jgi:putative PIN family toxin of toxin-antitoxin system
VLDTSVVVSALIFTRGDTARLRIGWQTEAFRPLVSNITVTELIRVLTYPKFKLDHDEQQELLADYLPWTEAIRIPTPAPHIPDCRDPFDRPFLELVVAGHADALISGDKALLELADKVLFRILTPADFLVALS